MPGIMNILVGVRGSSQTCTDLGNISGTGTNIGDMTAGGGIAAAFDYNTSQTGSAGARKVTTTSADVGKDWGSGNTKNICKYIVYGPSDDWTFASGAGTRTIKLQGSSTGSWSGEQVTLATTTVTSQSLGQSFTVDSGITAGAYRYHRWLFETDSSQSINCAEVRVWALA